MLFARAIKRLLVISCPGPIAVSICSSLTTATIGGWLKRIQESSKLIGRATTYTEQGGAVAKRKNIDNLDVENNRMPQKGRNRWAVESDLRATLREAGLSAWDVWRFSQYVGLTPAERLGVDSQAEVQAHYKRVEELRSANK